MCFVGDIQVFEKTKFLQELNLKGCRGLFGEFLERALSTIHVELDFSALVLFRVCPLTYLSVVFFYAGAFEVFSHLPSLTALDISSSKIDCLFALELLPNMPFARQLKVLKMANTNSSGLFFELALKYQLP